MKMREMKTKLLLITVMSLLLLSAAGCGGTIPEPLRQPAQKAVEKAVKTPGIDLHVNIGGLSSSGLNVGVEARINNPNLVSLDIGNLQVVGRIMVEISDTLLSKGWTASQRHPETRFYPPRLGPLSPGNSGGGK